jgi:hypothetical protein
VSLKKEEKMRKWETYSKWDMHHAATIPLVAALAPREVIPRRPSRTLRVNEKMDPMAPEAK